MGSAAELVLRALPPPWLAARMKAVRAGGTLSDWGTDANWPLAFRDGHVVSFKPGSHFTVNSDEYSHDVQIDFLGGRAIEGSVGLDLPLIPVYGDSFAFGLGVADDQTFLSLVSRGLPGRLVNFGMPGTALPQQVDTLEREHERLGSPNVCVFVFFMGNDFQDIVGAARAAAAHAPRPAAAPLSRVQRVNDWVAKRPWLSRLYVFQWARAIAVRAYNARQAVPLQDPVFLMMSQNAVFLDEAERDLYEAVNHLWDVARTRGFNPVAILIPDRYQVDDALRADWARYYGYTGPLDPAVPNRLIKGAFQRIGVPVIDATPCLRGGSGMYYVHDDHLTAAGHRAVASCIEAPLRARVMALFGEPLNFNQ
jgi:hypothetical protein